MADAETPALRIAANLSQLFTDNSHLTSRYQLAKASGFQGVEVVNPYEVATAELVKAKDEAKIEQAVLHAFIGETKGIAAVQNRLEEFRQCLELSIQYCNALKCSYLHIPAGVFPDSEEITNEYRNICHEVYISNLRHAAQRLEQEKITLLIEPLSDIQNYFLTSTSQALQVLNELGCSNVKLTLNLSRHQELEGNVIATLNQYQDSIGYIRLGNIADPPDGAKPEDLNLFIYSAFCFG